MSPLGFKASVGNPDLHFVAERAMHSMTFTSGATPADLLMASFQSGIKLRYLESTCL